MTLPAQLDIFNGRPRKGNAAVEFRLHCAIARVLRDHSNPGWTSTHLPFGEYRPSATAWRLKAMGTTAGWPDLMIVGPGRICFLELKRRGEKLSPVQAARATQLMAAGCGYGMAQSFDDAVSMLQAWGCVSMRVHPQ
jgi:hypothetical protein